MKTATWSTPRVPSITSSSYGRGFRVPSVIYFSSMVPSDRVTRIMMLWTYSSPIPPLKIRWIVASGRCFSTLMATVCSYGRVSTASGVVTTVEGDGDVVAGEGIGKTGVSEGLILASEGLVPAGKEHTKQEDRSCKKNDCPFHEESFGFLIFLICASGVIMSFSPILQKISTSGEVSRNIILIQAITGFIAAVAKRSKRPLIKPATGNAYRSLNRKSGGGCSCQYPPPPPPPPPARLGVRIAVGVGVGGVVGTVPAIFATYHTLLMPDPLMSPGFTSPIAIQ